MTYLATQGGNASTSPRSRRAWPVLLGLVAVLSACADSGTGPPVEIDPPLTGFEARNGAEFTTLAEELAFLAEVEAGSDRVRITEIGTSVQGRPMHLVRVGHPEPEADEQIAAGPTILIVGTQHGNEPAGREAALQFLRDLAFAEADALPDALGTTTVLFIPTANPDGRLADSRWNADLVDINRDHLALVSPEGRAIAQVIRDFRPDLVLDAHERPAATTPDMELLWPRNLNVYTPLRDLTRALVEDHLFPDLAATGWSVGLYGPGPGPPGDENENILRNAAGLRHALGLLVESAALQAPERRVAVHRETMSSVLEFFGDRSGDIVTVVTTAPAAKEATGRERSDPFYLFGADDDPPTSGQILDPPPCAYVLSTEQALTLQSQITLLGLRTETEGSDVVLSMAQPMMTVIPLLADDRARAPSVAGTPRVSDLECATP